MKTQKQKMYAMCLRNNGVAFALDVGKEYRVVRVKSYKKFGDLFYILEDGKAYASSDFSVTYTK